MRALAIGLLFIAIWPDPPGRAERRWSPVYPNPETRARAVAEILGHVAEARAASPRLWRVSLAVACHETADQRGPVVGPDTPWLPFESRLAREERNYHGHRYCPDEPHQIAAGDGIHRRFPEERGSWESWEYLLRESDYYGHVRFAIAVGWLEGRSQPDMERMIVNEMAATYCRGDRDWGMRVRGWLTFIREIEAEGAFQNIEKEAGEP